MIQKIFKHNNNRSSIALASIGSVVGLSILLISIQLYFDFKSLTQQENNTISNEFLVIKKNISELSTFGINTNSFSDQELATIANANFVRSMGVFKGCRYKVFVQLSEKGGTFPEFSTLAYFESIPDKYIDVNTNNWHWSKNDSLIPIILPSTYIDAYNFGIALSMGTPQLSKELLKSIPFKLIIQGNNKQKIYHARVISFSDRINSILVPNTFLEYTNSIYGNSKKETKSQLIIETTNTKNPEIAEFLNTHNYQTNRELIKENKLHSLLKNGLIYQLFISLIIVFQAIILFIFYSRILVNKSAYEIKTLLMLGYTINNISKSINYLIIKYYLIVVLISLFTVYLFKNYINYWFIKEKQISLNPDMSLYTFIIGFLFIVLFILINTMSTKKRISQISG